MVFSNVLLVFMISIQFGMYGLMIENTLQAFTGHLQVQAEGYKDDQKMRQIVPGIQNLASKIRTELGVESVSARASAFVLASSEDRTHGIQIIGVDPQRGQFMKPVHLLSSGLSTSRLLMVLR